MIVRRIINVERVPVESTPPRRYATAFHDHEIAIAFAARATREHYERFGMAAGCRWASRRNDS